MAAGGRWSKVEEAAEARGGLARENSVYLQGGRQSVALTRNSREENLCKQVRKGRNEQ